MFTRDKRYVITLLGFIFSKYLFITLSVFVGLMLENMEDLFNIESDESCCVCCPCFYYESASHSSISNATSGYGSISSITYIPSTTPRGHVSQRGSTLHIMGTRTIPPERLLQNILVQNYHDSKGHGSHQPLHNMAHGTLVSGSSNALLEPTTLHKYSHDMRELKFEFFNEESEPLVKNSSLASSPMKSSNAGHTGSRKSMYSLSQQHDSSNSVGGISSSNVSSQVQGNSLLSPNYSSGAKVTTTSKSFAASLIPEPIGPGSTQKSAKSSNAII